jgi:hypothetical protein
MKTKRHMHIQPDKDLDHLLKIEQWLAVTICVHSNHRNGSTDHHTYAVLYRIDSPREIIERRRWLIHWLVARYQVLFPRNSVKASFGYYDKKTGLDAEWIKAKRTAATYKGQLTKAHKALADHIEWRKSTILFYNEDEDVTLQKAKTKVLVKQKDLEDALAVLNQYEIINPK